MSTKDDPSKAQQGDQKSSQNDLAAKVAQAKASDDQLSKLQQKIAELEKQLAVLKETAARAQADLQNAKVRMEKEASEMRKFAGEMSLIKLIPIIDNFQRAFDHLPSELKDHQWVKGVEAIEKDLMKQVTEMGLKKIPSLGLPVDPHKHEVLMTADGEEGIIQGVTEEGWELHDKVLRAAKVIVGSGKEKPKDNT